MAEADDETRKSNTAHRTKVIQECAKELVRIKGERATLNEEAGGVRKRMRDNDIDVKAVEYTMRLLEMDDDDRGGRLDALKEAFKALGVGQQGSLFPDRKAA